MQELSSPEQKKRKRALLLVASLLQQRLVKHRAVVLTLLDIIQSDEDNYIERSALLVARVLDVLHTSSVLAAIPLLAAVSRVA